MATQSYPLGSLEGGLVTLTLEYDDVTLVCSRVVCDNQSAGVNARLTVIDPNTDQTLIDQVVFLPGRKLARNLPANLYLMVQHNGRLVPPLDISLSS